MSIQSEADWNGLRGAAHVARHTLDRLSALVKPGVTTQALDRVAARIFAAHGARSAPAAVYGFPGTVLISVNDEIVHGVPGRRRIRTGDLVTLDITVEKDGYVADTARTVLTEGLVLTIEPMISAGARRPVQDDDGWTIRTEDGSWSALYEHTLVITRGMPIVLTA